MLTRLFNQVARLKRSAGYTEAIGQDLRIIGIEDTAVTVRGGFLGIDTHAPYDDERALLVANTAETREYRMRFWDKGAPNGDWSPVQRVTVGA